MPEQDWEKDCQLKFKITLTLDSSCLETEVLKDLNDRLRALIEDFDSWSPETSEELNDLLRALRRKKGFGLFFVQCNPAQATQIIKTIRERFPQKRLEQFELNRQSETLYGDLLERYQAEKFDMACVTGVEQALYSYEDTKRLAGWSSEEIYNYSWKGVPPLLSHLNRQRETFEANLPIALIFLVRSFTINYFVQRAPDFFDWRSGFFKFSDSSENEENNSQEFVGKSYKDYDTLTSEQRIENILEIKEKIIQLEPSDCQQKSKLLREQGRLFESNQDLKYALDCYHLALKTNPQNHQAYKSKGFVLFKLERYEEAIQSYDWAVKIYPNYYKAWTRRGSVLEKLERYEEAINSYNRALEIQPDFYYARINLGNALIHVERYEEAIESYDLALGINSDDHNVWKIRGDVLCYLQKYQQAIKSYDHALKIKNTFYQAWNNRGYVFERLQKYQQAIKSYDRAIEIEPDFYYYWYKRGDILANLKRYKEAIKSYDHLVKLKPDNYDIWKRRGIILDQLKRYEEAIKNYDHFVKLK